MFLVRTEGMAKIGCPLAHDDGSRSPVLPQRDPTEGSDPIEIVDRDGRSMGGPGVCAWSGLPNEALWIR